MALTRAEFMRRFPEFEKATDSLVDAVLDVSSRELSPDVWGTRYEDGVYFATAHNLATSPFGINSRLATNASTSTYGVKLEEMRASVVIGIAVI